MHIQDAQDDVSILCQVAQMDPLAYKRFELPVIAPPVPSGGAKQAPTKEMAPDSEPVEVTQPATSTAAQNRSAESRPDKNMPVTSGRADDREPDRTREAASAERIMVRHAPSPLPLAVRAVENGLSALASVHDRVSPPSVLPLASAVGGGGTTTILGALGRALSILGERVLLVDANTPSILDYSYRNQCEESNLLLSSHSYSPFEGQVHILRSDCDGQASAQSSATRLHRAVAELRGRLDRILIAGRDAFTPAMAEQARAGGLCVVVLTPEVRCLVALPAILKTFRELASRGAGNITPAFLLNRFDPSNQAHSEARSVLAAELGAQLLPFWVPESPTVSQSLAQRVSPLDLAPQSPFAEACFTLAEWYRTRLNISESLLSESEENLLVSE